MWSQAPPTNTVVQVVWSQAPPLAPPTYTVVRVVWSQAPPLAPPTLCQSSQTWTWGFTTTLTWTSHWSQPTEDLHCPPSPPSPAPPTSWPGQSYRLLCCLYSMRDAKEGRKKEASKVKQTTRQSNTAHPRQLFNFLRKISCLRWDSNPRHSTL